MTFLSFLLVLFKLFGVRFALYQFFLEVFENFDYLRLRVLFDPFLHEISSFVLFCRLDLVNDHIIKVIAQYFSDFVAALGVIFTLVLTWIVRGVPLTLSSSSKS